MKVRLMFADRDVDLDAEPTAEADDLVADLQLGPLLTAAAQGDTLIGAGFRHALLSPLDSVEAIEYRQATLRECVLQERAVREIYDLTGQALAEKRHIFIVFLHEKPRMTLHQGVAILDALLPYLRRLRSIAQRAGTLSGGGLSQFFGAVLEELDETYFGEVADELHRLEFPGGMIIGKRLGIGLKGVDDVLHAPSRRSIVDRIGLGTNSYSFQLAARDEAGADALADLEDRGVNKAADATGRAGDHVLGFFTLLRAELAFYLGCLNLRHALTTAAPDDRCATVADADRPTLCDPRPTPTPGSTAESVLSAEQLINPCLSLGGATPVGNDVSADHAAGLIITGANSGGKSTFLRSLGIAELMMHAGMYVCAGSFTASLRTGIFTHFVREEDAAMVSGRFDEELKRMSRIVGALRRGGLVLMNESFASTNEGEGARIGADVLAGLVDAGVGVVMVTHLFELARRMRSELPDLSFLRAERLDDGSRTYRLLPGEPKATSYGQDIYRRLAPWPGEAGDDKQVGAPGPGFELAARRGLGQGDDDGDQGDERDQHVGDVGVEPARL